MSDGERERSLFLAPERPPEPEPTAHDGEPPAGRAAPLVEVEGGRRRWLAVLVVVALLVAGAVANRRSAERAEQAAVEDVADDQPASPGPPLVAPAMRTIEHFGPRLLEDTGTTLVLAAGTQVAVLDVDSGTLRNVQVADLSVTSSYPWGSQVLAVGGSFVVRSQPPRALLVPRADGVPVQPLDVGSGGGLYPSDVAGRYWVEEARGAGVLQELDASDPAGAITRQVPRIDGMRSIVWDGTGFIQSDSLRALATPADGGEPVPLAAGIAVAADGTTLALLDCPGDQPPCSLTLLDRATGSASPVELPEQVDGFELDGRATLSPDGRWLLVTVTSDTASGVARGRGLAVVDVETASAQVVEPAQEDAPVATGAFSPDGRWLFLAEPANSVEVELSAVDLGAGGRYALASVPLRASFGAVLEAFPSIPADLGAGG